MPEQNAAYFHNEGADARRDLVRRGVDQDVDLVEAVAFAQQLLHPSLAPPALGAAVAERDQGFRRRHRRAARRRPRAQPRGPGRARARSRSGRQAPEYAEAKGLVNDAMVS